MALPLKFECVFQNNRGLSALDPYWSRIIITEFSHCRPVAAVMGFINKCYNGELNTLKRHLARPVSYEEHYNCC